MMTFGCLLVLLTVTSSPRPPDLGTAVVSPPGFLLGAWEVERVLLNLNDQPRWPYQPNDPYLMGRELRISNEGVRFSLSEDGTCRPGGWSQRSATWGFLMEAGFSTSADASTTPADYGLKVSPRSKVTVYPFCPRPGANKSNVDADTRWVRSGFWLVRTGPRTIAMRLQDDVMLILGRRPAAAKPRPSFPCKRAESPTEKAICDSFTLAALDRSVALAWKRSGERGLVDAELAEDQKKWLRDRDACGTDTSCLAKSMEERITELPK
jgi:hypothetical protein